MREATDAPRWIANEAIIGHVARSRAASPMPLAFGEVAEFTRSRDPLPLVKVFLAGSFGVLLGLALIVWVFA